MKKLCSALSGLLAVVMILSVSGTASAQLSTAAFSASELLRKQLSDGNVVLQDTEENSIYNISLSLPSAEERMCQGEESETALSEAESQNTAFAEKLTALGGTVLSSSSRVLQTVTVRVSAVDIPVIRSMAEVQSVSASKTMTLMPSEVTAAESLQTSSLQSGDGAGTLVAVIDTGFSPEHATMQLDAGTQVAMTRAQAESYISQLGYGAYISEKIPFGFNYAEGSADIIESDTTHGTHVSAIATGNSSTMKGTAPNAQLLALRVFTPQSEGVPDYLVARAIEDAVFLGADVISISLGGDTACPDDENSTYADALSVAKAAGVMIAAAAGNDGTSDSGDTFVSGQYDNATVEQPSSYDSVLSVAAYDTSTNKMASFSSWGPLPDLSFSPNISAPGVNIYSALPTGYGKMSGTSMATPALAGTLASVIAVLKQRYPSAARTELAARAKAVVCNTADHLYSGTAIVPVRQQGSGTMNLTSALASSISVVSNGDTCVSLGVIGKEAQTLTVPLTVTALNGGTVSYSAGAGSKVYMEVNGVCQAITNASVTFGAAESSGDGTVTLNAQITLPSLSKDGYIEGYITLQDENSVSSSIPFLAYAGNWDSEKIFADGSAYGAISLSMLSAADHSVKKYQTVFSNDGLELMMPVFYQYRNAAYIKTSVYNTDGTLVYDVSEMQRVSKDIYLDSAGNVDTLIKNKLAFFSVMTNGPQDLQAGDYVYRIAAALYDGDTQTDQTVDLPFSIDGTAPSASVSVSGRTVNVALTDEHLYNDAQAVIVCDAATGKVLSDGEAPVTAAGDGKYTFSLPAGVNAVQIAYADLAGNCGEASVSLAGMVRFEAPSSPLLQTASQKVDGTNRELSFETLSYGYNIIAPKQSTGTFTDVGTLNFLPDTLTVNGQRVSVSFGQTIGTFQFSISISPGAGEELLKIVATKNGNTVLDRRYICVWDTQAPQIELSGVKTVSVPDWLIRRDHFGLFDSVPSLSVIDNAQAQMSFSVRENQVIGFSTLMAGTLYQNNDSYRSVTAVQDLSNWIGKITTATATDACGNGAKKQFIPVLSAPQLGDVDESKTVNTTDALLTLRFAVGSKEPSEYASMIADINADGKVNTTDALMILRSTVGKLNLEDYL